MIQIPNWKHKKKKSVRGEEKFQSFPARVYLHFELEYFLKEHWKTELEHHHNSTEVMSKNTVETHLNIEHNLLSPPGWYWINLFAKNVEMYCVSSVHRNEDALSERISPRLWY